MSDRYVVRRRSGESAVIDTFRKEVFCRVQDEDALNSDCASARCQDIAYLFNKARTSEKTP